MQVPECIINVTGQKEVPFGRFIFETKDGVSIVTMICQEIWSRPEMSKYLLENECEIIFAGNGSCFQMGKLKRRKKMLNNISEKRGVICYTNMKGTLHEHT